MLAKIRRVGREFEILHTNFHFDPIGALEMDKLLVGRHFIAPVQFRKEYVVGVVIGWMSSSSWLVDCYCLIGGDSRDAGTQ